MSNQNAVESVNEYAAGGKKEFFWENLTAQEKKAWNLNGVVLLSIVVILNFIAIFYNRPSMFIVIVVMLVIQWRVGKYLKKIQRSARAAAIGGAK